MLVGAGGAAYQARRVGPPVLFTRSGLAGPLGFCLGKSASLRQDALWAEVVSLGPAPGAAVKPAILTFLDLGGGKLSKGEKGGQKAKK